MFASSFQLRRPRIMAAIVIGSLGLSIGGLAARAAEPPSLDEIKNSLRQQRAKIESLYVEVKHEVTSPVDAKLLVSWPQFKDLMYLADDESRFAFKGDKRFHRTLQAATAKRLAPAAPPAVDPKASPLQQEAQRQVAEQYQRIQREYEKFHGKGAKPPAPDNADVVELSPDESYGFNGKVQWHRDTRGHGDAKKKGEADSKAKGDEKDQGGAPKAGEARAKGAATVFVEPADLSDHWFQPDYYLRNVGLAVLDPSEKDESLRQGQTMDLLPEALERWAYTVSPEIVQIDGAECVVLEGKIEATVTVGKVSETQNHADKLWLDLDHGLMVRQRERHSAEGGWNSRTVNSEPEEVAPGYWLPKTSRTEVLAPAEAPPEFQGKPALVEHFKLVRWVVNEVPDNLFDLVTKPGDTVHDLRVPLGTR